MTKELQITLTNEQGNEVMLKGKTFIHISMYIDRKLVRSDSLTRRRGK